MSTHSLEIVASTAEAAYATDGDGRIVAWNEAAGRLLGHAPRRVVGKRCHRIIRGKDLFGNRFCDERCPLFGMARRGEPVNGFRLNVDTAGCESLLVDVSVLVPPATDSEFSIIHVLTPVQSGASTTAFHASGHRTAGRAKPLTPREVEVLAMLSDGKSTRAIAEGLFISVETVRNHVKHILRKLEVHSRIEAIVHSKRGRSI